FSHPGIAAAMSEHFVNVKVDREERPDLDEVYMLATQLMTGHGGWPNSVFLTPELKPFFCGTYFPPDERRGMTSFPAILEGVHEAWQVRRDEVRRQAEEVASAMRRYLEQRFEPAERVAGRDGVAEAVRSLEQRFDAAWGGFGGAPKFPTPSNLLLLLERTADSKSRTMLDTTLDRMARGGIYDQLGGGFHRYATDREWKVPHFEKMLYDNGLLLEVYARAFAAGGEPEHARVVSETVGWLEREMRAPEGAFWSAVDAETHGHEGAFYVWTDEEIDGVLGVEDAAFLAPLLGFAGPPFFEGTHYVLHLPRPLAEQAERRRTTRGQLLAQMEPLRLRLLAAREQRERPLTDDKVLADWNGLAIAGLAAAAEAVAEPRWLRLAEGAADFVLSTLRTADGRLLHAWRGGRGEVGAFLADYSFLTHGLLGLHRATAAGRWLQAAIELTREQTARLAHPEGGFYAAAERPDLLFRSRDVFDGAVPAPNAVAVLNLLELAERTGEGEWRQQAERALRAFTPLLEGQPAAARALALAVARYHHLSGEEAAPAAGGAAEVASKAAPHEDLLLEAEDAVALRLTLPGEEPAKDPGGAEEEPRWQAFRVLLEVAPGWRLHPNPVAEEVFVPTRVEGVGCELREVRYPDPEPVLVGDEQVAALRGAVAITGEVRVTGPEPAALRVVYQACDAFRCLPTVRRELPLPRRR
ncbi:MAG TPA: thioredoxin domain-containing protein, partial [Thermoanaerobaculia bacterium]|nr:thioredoxin domain-containing protein [Thermoanaerobaculia bacterium]